VLLLDAVMQRNLLSCAVTCKLIVMKSEFEVANVMWQGPESKSEKSN
jgi:hypothetical protein